MQAYLLKLLSKSEQKTWSVFRSKCKERGIDIKKALLELISKESEYTQISKQLERIETLLTTPRTIKQQTKNEAINKKENKVKLIHEKRGTRTIQDLCKIASVKFHKHALSKYSNKTLDKILKILEE